MNLGATEMVLIVLPYYTTDILQPFSRCDKYEYSRLAPLDWGAVILAIPFLGSIAYLVMARNRRNIQHLDSIDNKSQFAS